MGLRDVHVFPQKGGRPLHDTLPSSINGKQILKITKVGFEML